MMAGDQIAGLISLTMALTLVMANLRGWQLPIGRMLTIALIWVFVIVGLTLLIARMGAHLPR